MSNDYEKYVIAEGTSEFNSNPEDFMNLVEDININQVKKQIGLKNSSLTDNTDEKSGNYNPTSNAPDVNAMKKILERFHGDAVYTIEKAHRNSNTRNDIEKMVLNESNVDKEWHVILEESTDKSTYKVVNSNSKRSFYDDLYLQQSAKRLAEFLNEGYSLNSKKVNEVLYYDGLYKKHYNEAMHSKYLYNKAKRLNESKKMNILLDKFENSRHKALEAKKKLKFL